MVSRCMNFRRICVFSMYELTLPPSTFCFKIGAAVFLPQALFTLDSLGLTTKAAAQSLKDCCRFDGPNLHRCVWALQRASFLGVVYIFIYMFSSFADFCCFYLAFHCWWDVGDVMWWLQSWTLGQYLKAALMYPPRRRPRWDAFEWRVARNLGKSLGEKWWRYFLMRFHPQVQHGRISKDGISMAMDLTHCHWVLQTGLFWADIYLYYLLYFHIICTQSVFFFFVWDLPGPSPYQKPCVCP